MPIRSDAQKLSIYRDPAVAERYDERWAGAAGRRRDERTRRAVERALAGLGAIESVLDAPCGAGRLSAWLSERAAHYAGADIALPMLLQARSKRPDPLFAADLARLPLRSAGVDVAVCIRLLHLVRSAELRVRLLSELARVARRAVVLDYVQAGSLKVCVARARAALGMRDHAPCALSRAQLRAELDCAGLECVAFEPVRSPAWLSDKLVVLARPVR